MSESNDNLVDTARTSRETTVAMSSPGLVGTVRNPRAAEVWMMALISVCYGLEVCLAPSWVT